MPLLTMITVFLLMMLTPVAATSGDADDGMHLRLLCYNIRFGTANDGPNHWDLRRDIALDVIERWDSDIIGIQEALRFQLDEMRERFPHYGEIGVARDDGRISGEYSSILYRLDRFAVADAGTFWLSDTPDKVASITWGNAITRICTWARLVEHETGRGVYVYNTHFDHVSQPSRERSIRLIAEHIAARPMNDPVVFMGDLNVPEDNPVMEFVFSTSDGMGMVDTFRVIHPDEPLAGTFHAFRGRRDNRKIDYILVDPRARVLEAAIDHTNVDGRYPSDHYPVSATVVLHHAAD